MKKQLIFLAVFLFAMNMTRAQMQNDSKETTKHIDFVDPKIGSGGHGHVFVGANVPYGMVQLGPTNFPQSWDRTSGYHDSDSTLIGFSHTHLSGTGIGDLFDITVMPVIGSVTYTRGLPKGGIYWNADRQKEIATPGYYSVPVKENGILAELTSTSRTGMHRYTFPSSDSIALVFDLENGGCWDAPYFTQMQQTGPNTISGQRFSKGWANNQKIYFVAEFSQPISSFTLHGEKEMYGRVDFAPLESSRQIEVKVGISPNSIEGARNNLMAEALDISFDQMVANARKSWENVISRIEIKCQDPEELKKLYTSLYHFMIHPSDFNDVNETPQYTILSLWDTYRAAMPLLSIIDPDRTGEIINSMLDIHDVQGRLPVWHLWGCETDCMVGNPGIIVVADAIVKDIPNIDKERAFKALLTTSNDTARGGGIRQKYGFIPADLKPEAIAWDLEYAIADAAIANAALSLGQNEIAQEYGNRSKSYKNYFDPDTKFLRGKFSDGTWRTPFNPSYSSIGNDYCEGNAWQYTWLVPHDIEGLKELYGGKEPMIANLDSLFAASPELAGENITPDISGFIGQYVHGNEPSHHIAYIYSMIGEREKTAALVNRIIDEQYSALPDGLSGNEDCGQMSAWYVFSALGFYPVTPAGALYWLGTPRYTKASINLPGDKKFIVKKGSKGDGSVYLNGERLSRNYLTHSEIISGGELIF